MFGDGFINTLRGIKGSIAPVQPINEAAENGKIFAPLLGTMVGGRRSAPYNKVHGFESDAKTYADLPSDDPDAADKLTWADYTVYSNDGSGKRKSFSVGYDDNGKIAAIQQNINVDGSTRRALSLGRKNLKDFFSKFDRDATNYSVWQEWHSDDGKATAREIFNSKETGSPFIPSMIFKGDVKTTQPRRSTPIQDDFTGNLRSTRPGVSNGLNGLK